VYTIDGTVEHFAADFQQGSQGASHTLFGSLRIKSNVPLSSPWPLPTPTPMPCTGDCNGNGRVDIGELIVSTNVALGSVPVDRCPAIDCRRTGEIGIECLTHAVSAALHDCE
jgi:hypothetical protein